MIGFVISVIASSLLAADQVLGSVFAKERNNKITEIASKMYNEIAKDRALLNMLYEAYLKRDTALASDIINSSPFGNRIRVLRKEIKANYAKGQDVSKQISNLDYEQQKVQSSINDATSKSTTTGSAIGDLISGAAKDQTSNIIKPTLSGTTEQTIKEINYGQK